MNLLTLNDNNLATLHRQAAAEIARSSRRPPPTATMPPASFAATRWRSGLCWWPLPETTRSSSSARRIAARPCCGPWLWNSAWAIPSRPALVLAVITVARFGPATALAAKIERCRAAWPVADITIEVVQPPQRELNGRPGTGVAEMKAQIARMSSHTDLTLDQDSANLLKCACAEYGIDPDARNRIIAIARTIANLDWSRADWPRPYLRSNQLPGVPVVKVAVAAKLVPCSPPPAFFMAASITIREGRGKR